MKRTVVSSMGRQQDHSQRKLLLRLFPGSHYTVASGRQAGIQPVVLQFEADCCGYLYHRNLDSELKGTPWQYSALKEYYVGDPTPLYAGQYLQKYLRYPMLEYLVKLKLYRLATYVAYGDTGGARFYDDSVLNSKGKTVTEVWASAKIYTALQTIDPGPDQLTMIKAFLRDNIRPDLELMKWCSKTTSERKRILRFPCAI